MVAVLPYVPSFGEKLAHTFGGVAAQLGEGYAKRRAETTLQNLLGSVQGQSNTPGTPMDQMNQQAAASSSAKIDPFKVMELQNIVTRARGPEAGKAFGNAFLESKKLQSQEDLQTRKFEHERASKAEPELLEREAKLNNLEQEGVRFERLQQLFSPELENKFPSSFTAALSMKNGELRPIASSLLSEEAQESVKLVADNLAGAKDTFGARVTNFDVQSYMKRLPSLLNTAEGRRRVLRDLRLLNKLNIEHESGVLGIIDREGGPSKISISQAERRYRKEHSKEIESIKKEFINPEKKNYSEKPDAKIYQGRTLEDEETGEKYISNGKEWVVEK